MDTNNNPQDTPQPRKIQPPVDLNKPVENPTLLAAIQAFAQTRTPQTLHELQVQLNQANYLVPFLGDEMRSEPSGIEGQSTIKAGSKIKFLLAHDEQDNTILPLFTDWNEIRAWTKEPVDTFVMPANDAWGFVLYGSTYAGAVINPGGMALPLNRLMVEDLKGNA